MSDSNPTQVGTRRAEAIVMVTWDPNTGELTYKADGANAMEQLGILAHASQTLWATLQKPQRPITIYPPTVGLAPRGRG